MHRRLHSNQVQSQSTLTGSRDILKYPRHKFGDSRAHPRQIRLRTPDAPGDDAGEEIAAVLAAHLQRPTRVTLTGVLAAGLVARAQEDVGDVLVTAGTQEHALAVVVADDGHLDLKECGWWVCTTLQNKYIPPGALWAACHPRSTVPIPSPSHSPQSANHPMPANKSARYAAQTPTPYPAVPAPNRTRTWRNCTWDGRSFWRLHAPRRVVPLARWRSRTRPLLSGFARLVGWKSKGEGGGGFWLGLAYSSTQWPAVAIQFSLRMAPPQRCVLEKPKNEVRRTDT